MIWVSVLFISAVLQSGLAETELNEDAKSIDLSSQSFVGDFNMDFSAYKYLEEIDLSNNDIGKVEPDIFAKNQLLESADFSGNKHLMFPEIGSFLESQSLRSLNLSGCHLDSVPGNAFDDLVKLKVLDLSNNPIDFLSSKAFETMKHFPHKLIVSRISLKALKYICQKAKNMTVVVKEGKSKHLKCEEHRSESGFIPKQDPAQASHTNLIEDEFMLSNSNPNMDELMMGDQPTEDDLDEGSGEPDGEVLKVDVVQTDGTELEIAEPVVEEKKIDDVVAPVVEQEAEQPEETKEQPGSVDGAGVDNYNEHGNDEMHHVNAQDSEVPAADSTSHANHNVSETNKTAAGRSISSAVGPQDEEVKTGASSTTGTTTNESSGSNVALFLVIGVAVAGVAAVGYKYYNKKNNARKSSEEPVAREMTEIKVVDKSESRPLVKDDVDIKEVNDDEEAAQYIPLKQHVEGAH